MPPETRKSASNAIAGGYKSKRPTEKGIVSEFFSRSKDHYTRYFRVDVFAKFVAALMIKLNGV